MEQVHSEQGVLGWGRSVGSKVVRSEAYPFFFSFLAFFGIGATIRTHQEIKCLPSAGFCKCTI